jgi:6-pyruvoyltetrahydropterin/6-carboxytetrahydropterin synthase
VYEVTIIKSFSAAHALKDIGGNCEDLHGHNFTVEVSIASSELTSEGILIDFRILKKWTDDILVELDHKYLNDISHFKNINPSSELIAKFIYDKIYSEAHRRQFEVSHVSVWESEDAKVSYYGNK